LSERRDDDETRAGIIDKGAGAAERGAIAARDDDNDDETAGATRTPAEERREIIVLGRGEPKAEGQRESLKKGIVLVFSSSTESPLSKKTLTFEKEA
jgi:hypothetical protein